MVLEVYVKSIDRSLIMLICTVDKFSLRCFKNKECAIKIYVLHIEVSRLAPVAA